MICQEWSEGVTLCDFGMSILRRGAFDQCRFLKVSIGFISAAIAKNIC
jgi:hypothetical protein